MKFKEISLEVLQAEGPIVQVTRQEIQDLKERAARSPRRRSRICAHPGPDDPTHEMLVALAYETYIRPHVHPGKVESFNLVDGRMSVVLFEDDGRILEVVRMGDLPSGRSFYYRQTRPIYHTILPESDVVVFQEVTQGPFSREGTVWPSWAPEDEGKLKEWIVQLRQRVIGTDRGSETPRPADAAKRRS